MYHAAWTPRHVVHDFAGKTFDKQACVMAKNTSVRPHMDKSFDVHSFDPVQLPEAYFANPYPILHAMREHAPGFRCPDGSVPNQARRPFQVYRDPGRFLRTKPSIQPTLGVVTYEHHTTSLVFNDPLPNESETGVWSTIAAAVTASASGRAVGRFSAGQH